MLEEEERERVKESASGRCENSRSSCLPLYWGSSTSKPITVSSARTTVHEAANDPV